MNPNQEQELQQALYYLNNRHELGLADMPKYVQAIELAQRHGLKPDNGRWYLPAIE